MGCGGVDRAGREGILVRGKCVRFCMFIVTAMGERNRVRQGLGFGIDRAI